MIDVVGDLTLNDVWYTQRNRKGVPCIAQREMNKFSSEMRQSNLLEEKRVLLFFIQYKKFFECLPFIIKLYWKKCVTFHILLSRSDEWDKNRSNAYMHMTHKKEFYLFFSVAITCNLFTFTCIHITYKKWMITTKNTFYMCMHEWFRFFFFIWEM